MSINKKEPERDMVYSEPLVAEVIRGWMENNQVRWKGATMYKYSYLVDAHLIPSLGHIPIRQLTAREINIFLFEKVKTGRLDGRGGLSPTYVKTIMLILQRVMEYAASEQLCPPLAAPICKPQGACSTVSVLGIEEQRKLERFLDAGVDETGLGVAISLYTGMRLGEVCALKWEDVDLKVGVIHVNRTVARVSTEKTGRKTQLILDTPKTKASRRDIPVCSRLLFMLQRQKRISHSEFLTSETSLFISPRTYEYRYRRLLDECGIAYLNYHALRHTFATRCIEAGADIKSLSEILGHASVSVTMNTYVHSSMELKRKQVEKMSLMSVRSA